MGEGFKGDIGALLRHVSIGDVGKKRLGNTKRIGKLEKLVLDPKKAKVKVIYPEEVELELVEIDHESITPYQVWLSIKEYGSGLYVLGEWTDRETAEQEYKKILGNFKSGNYELHLYTDGNIEFCFD